MSQEIVTVSVLMPSPKKKRKKSKSFVGALGDAIEEDDMKLTIFRYVQLNEAKVKKLGTRQLKVMKALYKSTFDYMYKWVGIHLLTQKIYQYLCILTTFTKFH